MVVKKAFDVAMSTTKLSLCTAYNHLSVFYYMSGVNNVFLLVINYLSQRCRKLSKVRRYKVVPGFRKLSKGVTGIVQVCGSCRMPRFCAGIVLAFISG